MEPFWYRNLSDPSVWHPTPLKAASYRSSSMNLHLWFKCQESSPILKCTVVMWLSDLISLIPGTVGGMDVPCHGLPPTPCCHGDRGGWHQLRPTAEHFSSNQDIVYQSLETTPSAAWWQCAISYCILETDCLLRVWTTFENGVLKFINYLFEKPSKSIWLYIWAKSPIFVWRLNIKL